MDVMSYENCVVECGADLPWSRTEINFTRKHYYHPTNTQEFRTKYKNAGVYQTMMTYIDPIWFQNENGKWIVNTQDSLKFGDFYLDFDTTLDSEDDFLKIKQDVDTAIRFLKIILNIDYTQIKIFFSGFKGVHLIVPAAVIGIKPHVALHQIYRDIALQIYERCKHKTMDKKMYDDKRMFRMPNSFNLKGKAYKIPITFQEIRDLSLSQIRELAKDMRPITQLPIIPSPRAKLAFDKYVKEWSQKVVKARERMKQFQKLDTLPVCIEAMLNKVFRETVDKRNNSGTALASFFMQQGLPREETLDRMIAWGAGNCQPPLSEKEMEVIVHSVYNGQYRFGCDSFKEYGGVCNKAEGLCPLFKK